MTLKDIKGKEELIDSFNEEDKNTDCTFFSLPAAAQEICYRIFAESNSRSEIIRNLDRCEDLRYELGNGDKSEEQCQKEIDGVMRHADFLIKEGHLHFEE